MWPILLHFRGLVSFWATRACLKNGAVRLIIHGNEVALRRQAAAAFDVGAKGSLKQIEVRRSRLGFLSH